VAPGSNVTPARGAVLFFTPEAGVVPHLVAQCLLARTLVELGQQVLMVRCHGLFNRCPVMDMFDLPYQGADEDKRQACGRCLHASNVVLSEYGLPAIALKDFLTPAVTERLAAVKQEVATDPRRFTFDGIAFGELCTQDLALGTKVSDFSEVSGEHHLAFCQYIFNAVASYLLTGALMAQVPVAKLVTHNDYGLLVGARLAAQRRGVPAWTVSFASHLVVDRRRLLLLPEPIRASDRATSADWPRFRDLALPEAVVKELTDDTLARLGSKGSHVYSPAKTFAGPDLHAQLGIPAGKTLLVAYTSSLDERLAAIAMENALALPAPPVQQPFADQIDWLAELCRFVEASDRYFLVVRVHPREGANKRERRVSQHLVKLRASFDRPFANCRFVWPEDKVSSYDLGEIADVVLTSWSTIGIELARLGVPVLTSTHGMAPWPDDDFQVWGGTREGYFRHLVQLAQRAPDWQPLLHAHRWAHLHILARAVVLDDVVPAHDFDGVPEFRLPRAARAIGRSLIEGVQTREQARQALAAGQGGAAGAREQAALARQLRRVLHYLFTGQDRDDDYQLTVVPVTAGRPVDLEALAARTAGDGAAAVIVAEGRRLHFAREGRVSSRHSPMAWRLASLAGQLVREQPGVAAAGEDPTAAVMARLRRLRDQGRVVEALAAVRDERRRHPDDPELPNLEGQLVFMSGAAEPALAIFRDVAARWPRFARGRNNLAMLLWHTGDRLGALEQLAAAHAREPHDPDIVRNAAWLYEQAGRRADAVAVCVAYLRARADDESIQGLLAQLTGGGGPARPVQAAATTE
jgi:hypothetical protein